MIKRIAVLIVMLAGDGHSLPAQHESRVAVMSGSIGRAINDRMMALTDSGFSGAIAVELRDTLVLEAGYGLANRERHIPFTVSTIAQIGSLSKAFTAAAIVDLVQRGRLRYTDSLERFLPDLPMAVRPLTIEMLLNHTAGLREDCGEDFDRRTKRELVSRCLAFPLKSPAGTAFQYSNIGYSVLAAVVEEVTHAPLETFLREHFFIPLGLRHIGYAFPGVSPDSIAAGYKNGVNQGNIRDSIAALGGDFWDVKGNGGLQASTDEMYRWYRELKNGSIVNDSMRAALFSRHAEREQGVFYGYGWFLRLDSAGHTIQISHSGSDGTFEALWYWRPVDRVFIYTVSNFGENDLAAGAVSTINAVIRTAAARGADSKP